MRLVFSAAVLLFSALALADEYADKTVEEFVKISDLCFDEQKVPEDYKEQFNDFTYPDEEIVYEYLRCVWWKLQLWDEVTGFSVGHIAHLYKGKGNTKKLIPVLTECNENKEEDPPLKQLYRGYNCILDTPVGEWFKDSVKKYISTH